MLSYCIRPIADADWPAILALQAAAYHAFDPESEAVMRSKQQLGPHSCLVAEAAGEVVGYCLAHPWRADEPAGLDTLYPAPAGHGSLYIHDVVVSETCRGQGIAEAFLHWLEQKMPRLPAQLSLVAVQGADSFWRRHRFRAVACRKELDAYGPGAVYMQR